MERTLNIKITIPLHKKIWGFLTMGIYPPKTGKVMRYRSDMMAYEIYYNKFGYKTMLIAVEHCELI